MNNSNYRDVNPTVKYHFLGRGTGPHSSRSLSLHWFAADTLTSSSPTALHDKPPSTNPHCFPSKPNTTHQSYQDQNVEMTTCFRGNQHKEPTPTQRTFLLISQLNITCCTHANRGKFPHSHFNKSIKTNPPQCSKPSSLQGNFQRPILIKPAKLMPPMQETNFTLLGDPTREIWLQ